MPPIRRSWCCEQRIAGSDWFFNVELEVLKHLALALVPVEPTSVGMIFGQSCFIPGTATEEGSDGRPIRECQSILLRHSSNEGCLIAMDILGGGLVGRPAQEIGKLFDVADILVVRLGAEPADRHVLDPCGRNPEIRAPAHARPQQIANAKPRWRAVGAGEPGRLAGGRDLGSADEGMAASTANSRASAGARRPRAAQS